MSRLRLAFAAVVAGSCFALRAEARMDPVIPTGPPEVPRADHLPAAPTADELGWTAPVLSVDRFSDAAGTLLRRSLDPKLPKPNESFSLDDAKFKLAVAGPGGFTGQCYNLDVRPAKPNRYYVFYDRLNNYRLGQYPVIEKAPGDPGYSDLWDIWKIVTPDTFQETNWVRDAATVDRLLRDPAGGFRASSTGVYLNAPIVPDGTKAGSKAEGKAGAARLWYAWYQGKRAPFLYFEGSLHLASDGGIPVAAMKLSGKRAHWPPAEPLQALTWPKGPGYSPLVTVTDAADHPVIAGTIDCPVVGTASP